MLSHKKESIDKIRSIPIKASKTAALWDSYLRTKLWTADHFHFASIRRQCVTVVDDHCVISRHDANMVSAIWLAESYRIAWRISFFVTSTRIIRNDIASSWIAASRVEYQRADSHERDLDLLRELAEDLPCHISSVHCGWTVTWKYPKISWFDPLTPQILVW
jgi:hypothetical protein